MVLQSMIARRKDFALPILSSPSTCVRTPPSRRRAMAIARSRSVSRFVLAGKSSKMKYATIAHTMVAAPSTMNNHRHPRRPAVPSIPPVIAPARRPPNAPLRIAADMYTPKRFDCSSFLYQDDMMRIIPGAKPDSKTPTKIRRRRHRSRRIQPKQWSIDRS